MAVRFVGVDLAWSPCNPSAAAALGLKGEVGELTTWTDQLRDDDEIVAFVRKATGEGPALIAIDAPLVVPNEEGTRPCDREVSKAFRSQEAGAYPANRRKFGGRVRGENLVRRLERMGFEHSPYIPARTPVRQVIEVYPHPAAVRLFGLDRTLKYKARPGRSYSLRWAELRRYQRCLRSLKDPGLSVEEILEVYVEGLRGGALKRYEDLIDALFCAYIGLYCWYWGPEGYQVFGDLDEGYIAVPRKGGNLWEDSRPSRSPFLQRW